MSDRRVFRLSDEKLRAWVASFVATAPLGVYVEVRPENRNDAQNRLLHALIAEAVGNGLATDNGTRLTLEDAKTALVTGWMGEAGQASDMVIFAGRPVQLRRSTTTFSKAELSSLIEYIRAECAMRGIQLRDREAA